MPTKKNKGTSSWIVTRIKAAVILIAGLFLLILGIAMWQSPEVNMPGFVGAWNSLGDEFNRLKNDPFAILGILVIIVAVVLAYTGIKRLIKGKPD